MRISDWSSDVCSSDLKDGPVGEALDVGDVTDDAGLAAGDRAAHSGAGKQGLALLLEVIVAEAGAAALGLHGFGARLHEVERSEERRVGKGGVRQRRSRWWPDD